MKTVKLNVKEFGLQHAIVVAMNTNNVEVIVSMPSDFIPFKCDWYVSDKQIKGIADVIALVDNKKMYFKWI